MSGKAARVVITERQQAILQQLSSSTTVAYRLRQRANIIPLAFEQRLNRDIAPIVSLGTGQVGAWRRRWQQEFERLTLIEGSRDRKSRQIFGQSSKSFFRMSSVPVVRSLAGHSSKSSTR
jgi:hypothetical protein